MDTKIVKLRRERLLEWLKDHSAPPEEKSYFSQLKGYGSFGEKAARRLEQKYGMGDMYLDTPVAENGSASQPVESAPSPKVTTNDDTQLIRVNAVERALLARYWEVDEDTRRDIAAYIELVHRRPKPAAAPPGAIPTEKRVAERRITPNKINFDIDPPEVGSEQEHLRVTKKK